MLNMLTLEQQKSALENDLRALAVQAKSQPNGELTDDQFTEAQQKLAELYDVKGKIANLAKSRDLLSQLAELNPAGEKESNVDSDIKTPGEWFIKKAGDRLLAVKGVTNATVAAPEFVPEAAKAATDTQVVPAGLVSSYATQYDRTIVTAYRRRLVVADLLSSGTLTSATAVTYLVEGVLEGDFATVAEGGKKPQIHFADPAMATDSLKKIAGIIKFSDEMVEDFGFLVTEINNRGLYQLGLKEEQQLLNGDGTGSNVLGLLNRPGVQIETSSAVADNPDAIFRATTKIAMVSGMDADGVMINPIDYQAMRLSKDANGQYFGGGFFQGQYGNSGILLQPDIWGLPTVVTPAAPQGTAIVGAFRQAATVYRKGGVRVESTNSNKDEFEYNLITVRIEERVALAVRYPSALVKVTLAA